jgi:hypothetical protein
MTTRSFLILILLSLSLGASLVRGQDRPSPTQEAFADLSNPAAATPSAHPKDFLRERFYASAKSRPLMPEDISAREAVRALGVDRHRFVRVQLNDGSTLTGGILSITDQQFTVSQGILDETTIRYSSLKRPPQPTLAPAEHWENGLKWTGLVALCVALSPVAIVLLPLLFTGVIAD